MMRFCIILLISSAAVWAQIDPVPQVGDFSKLPTYLVGVGAEVNPYGVITTLGIRVAKTNFYSWTTLDTPAQQLPGAFSGSQPTQIVASVRTGVAFVAAHSGACFLFFLGDAGGVLGGTATLGAYSGGGGVFCNTHAAPSLYFGPVVRAVKLSSSTVQPIAEFMVSWSF